jgi:hypothetical protein
MKKNFIRFGADSVLLGGEKREKKKESEKNQAGYDLIIFSRYVAIMSASRLAKY